MRSICVRSMLCVCYVVYIMYSGTMANVTHTPTHSYLHHTYITHLHIPHTRVHHMDIQLHAGTPTRFALRVIFTRFHPETGTWDHGSDDHLEGPGRPQNGPILG